MNESTPGPMMNQYLFEIALPEDITEEFIALIPHQRAHIDTLMVKGIVTSYSLAIDRSRLWVTLLAHSEEDAAKTLETFPMHKFFDARMFPLAFHNMTFSLAKVSLN